MFTLKILYFGAETLLYLQKKIIPQKTNISSQALFSPRNKTLRDVFYLLYSMKEEMKRKVRI